MYFDSSALLSLFVKRKFSSQINEFVHKQNQAIRIWSFGVVEIHSALKQMARVGEITENQRISIIREIDYQRSMGNIIVEEQIESKKVHDLAVLLIEKPEFKGKALDTIHVASALILGESIFASTDIKQRELATREGLNVQPSKLILNKE